MRMVSKALMVATALGLGSIAGAGAPAGQLIEKAAVRPQQPRGSTLRAIFGGGLVPPERGGRRGGPGWSTRHVQRMAAKKRNQARHRAACRGKRRSRA